MRCGNTLIALLALVPGNHVLAQAAEQPAALASVVVQPDVEFGKVGDRLLKLDLLRPKEPVTNPLPAIVFVHGGGWYKGDKKDGIKFLQPLVASGNYIGATIDYRLSGEAVWPAQIHDCKAAIRWLRAHATKYGIDPDRIGVCGSSAGGHLVNMLGVSGDVKDLEGTSGTPDQSSRVACVVDFCGPSDLRNPDLFPKDVADFASRMLGGPATEKTEAARSASPVVYVSKDDPPFSIVHGTADVRVPFVHAELLHAALQAAGTDVTLVKIKGGGHGMGGAKVMPQVQTFLDKHLRGKK